MNKGDKVYSINNMGYVDIYYIEKSGKNGITYISNYLTDKNTYSNPMNSKLFYGARAEFFQTKEEALAHYTKKQNDKIQFAKDNLCK